MEYEAKIRAEYLKISLVIERMLSDLLAQSLEIENFRDTKSFGTSSEALSFNSRVNLFLDMSIVGKDEKSKLQKFMEIRNKFMHVEEANTYEKCVSYISDMKNFLKRHYPPDNSLSDEENLRNAGLDLASDALSIISKIINAVGKTNINRYNKLKNANVGLALSKVMEHIKKENSQKLDHETMRKFQRQLFEELMKVENNHDIEYAFDFDTIFR